MSKFLPVILFAGLLFTTAPKADVVLVKDGKTNAEIIISEKPLISVKLAAENLQEFVEKISGARLKIVTEPTATGKNKIYVGKSKETEKKGINLVGLKDEGFKIIAKDNYVAVIGKDEERKPFLYNLSGKKGSPGYEKPLKEWQKYSGSKTIPTKISIGLFNVKLGFHTQDATATLYGVSRLLEQFGVRFYSPYENGTVVPAMQNISVKEQETVMAPKFPFRYPLYYGSMKTDRDGVLWLKRLGYGSSYALEFGHTMRNIMRSDDLMKEHPEYYAKADGKILIGHNGGVPKLTNQGLRKEAVNYMRKTFDAYPPLKSMSLGMPDGFTKIDDDDNAKWVKPDADRYQKFSNYVWDFWLYAAGELKKSHPDKMFNVFSYTTYKEPPTTIDKLPDNISLCMVYTAAQSMVPENQYLKDLRKRWLSMLTSKKLYLWEHLLFYRKGKGRPRVPVIYTKITRQEMQYLHGKCEGIIAEVQPGHHKNGRYNGRLGCPGMMHLMHYLKGKLYWNPDLDIEALLNEYYKLFYGPAAAEMKEYYEFAEEVWTRPETRSITIAKGFLKEKDIDRYFDILKRAREKAGTGSVYDKRIAVIEDEMQPVKKLFPNLARTGPFIRIYPLKDKITIDGKLDENSWNYIKAWRPMRDLITGKKMPPENLSTVAFRMDRKNRNALYIGVKCFEKNMDKLKASAKGHDDFDIFNDDVIEIYIETPDRSYFKIAINTAGKIWDESTDATIVNRDTLPHLWEPGTKAAVHKDKDYFSVEVMIPTADFGKLGPFKNFPWGINVCRAQSTGGDVVVSAISPTGKKKFAVMSKLANIYLK